ncbi:MAG: hypothetical protein WA086_09870, partial [Ideonella sp.]
GASFERLLTDRTAPSVRRRAWFHLARMRYQAGQTEAAADALSRIDGPLANPLQDQRTLLEGQVWTQLGQAERAAAALRPLAERTAGPANSQADAGFGDTEADRSSRYARYNLGVALIRSGDRSQGMAWLDKLGQAGAGNEEMRSLRDQANLALGYAALQAEQPEQARQWLERVRLNGLQANKALLGFGWAALALKQPKLALVPWTELASRSDTDPAVLEARLAVPQALVEMGALGPALAQFEQAIAHFEQEDALLDRSISTLRDPGWLLASAGTANGDPTPVVLQDTPDFVTPLPPPRLPPLAHDSHLGLVMAGAEFQRLRADQRDLQQVQSQLSRWQDKLATFQDLLAAHGPQATPTSRALQARIAELDRQVQALQPQARAAQEQRQQALQRLAIDTLLAQKDRLANYRTQARYALAQLHDQSQDSAADPARRPQNPEADRATPR